MKRHLLIAGLLVALGLLAYAGSLSGEFLFDDQHHIVENSAIRGLENIPDILNGPRGLVMATFALNYAASGLDAFGYRLTNVFLHIVNGFLVYLLFFLSLPEAKGDDRTWGWRIAVFASLFFVVHPLHTQAIHLVAQRLEIMATTFYLLCLFGFCTACRQDGERWRHLLLIFVVLMFSLGTQCKEIIVTVPAAVLLYDYVFNRFGRSGVPFRSRWLWHGILWTIALLFAVKRLVAESSSAAIEGWAQAGLSPGAGFAVRDLTSWEYFLTQSNVLIHYLSLIVAPIKQNLDFDFPIARSLFVAPVASEGTALNFILLPPILALLILGGLLVWAIVLARRDSPQARVVSFCVLMYFIVLSPTSSFVPIVDVINEHRVYLASVFVILPMVMSMDRLGGVLFERKKRG